MQSPGRPGRDDAIDLLRGLAMVVMALDHARDFFGDGTRRPLDLATTTLPLFFTRWVTHFCAPVFVLLAGVSAFLATARGRSRGANARLLVTRGLWLVVLELTVVRFGWLFDVSYHFVLLQVIWAIGWSMVVLAALQFLPAWGAGAFGAVLVLGHNALDRVHVARGARLGWLWRLAHEPAMLRPAPGVRVMAAYPLIPWVGVMALGYALGALLTARPAHRRRTLLALGAALVTGFVALRAAAVYGDPEPWHAHATLRDSVLAFLDCEKYPPSLLYLCMTLGPALLAWGALAGRSFPRGPGGVLVTFGRVPLFYYVLHLSLLHALAGAYVVLRGGVGALAAVQRSPRGVGGSLPVVYLGWAVGVALLYPACRWFAGVKQRRRDWWLSYL